MNKLEPKRSSVTLIILIIAITLAVYFETRLRPVPGQAPLTDIQNIETLRTAFNHDVGKTRLIILVSPT